MASHCLRCQAPIRLGTLCPEHSSQLATTDTLIAEHVVARAEAEPLASLVDQWGRVHGVSERYRVGRSSDESDLAILHPSVSSVHAELRCDAGNWQLVDLGSLNGTTRNGQAHSRGMVEDGDLLRFGDVALFFLARRPGAEPQVAGTLGSTVPTKQKDLGFEVTLRCPSGDLELLQRPGGGIVSKPAASSKIGRAHV